MAAARHKRNTQHQQIARSSSKRAAGAQGEGRDLDHADSSWRCPWGCRHGSSRAPACRPHCPLQIVLQASGKSSQTPGKGDRGWQEGWSPVTTGAPCATSPLPWKQAPEKKPFPHRPSLVTCAGDWPPLLCPTFRRSSSRVMASGLAVMGLKATALPCHSPALFPQKVLQRGVAAGAGSAFMSPRISNGQTRRNRKRMSRNGESADRTAQDFEDASLNRAGALGLFSWLLSLWKLAPLLGRCYCEHTPT